MCFENDKKLQCQLGITLTFSTHAFHHFIKCSLMLIGKAICAHLHEGTNKNSLRTRICGFKKVFICIKLVRKREITLLIIDLNNSSN